MFIFTAISFLKSKPTYKSTYEHEFYVPLPFWQACYCSLCFIQASFHTLPQEQVSSELVCKDLISYALKSWLNLCMETFPVLHLLLTFFKTRHFQISVEFRRYNRLHTQLAPCLWKHSASLVTGILNTAEFFLLSLHIPQLNLIYSNFPGCSVASPLH